MVSIAPQEMQEDGLEANNHTSAFAHSIHSLGLGAQHGRNNRRSPSINFHEWPGWVELESEPAYFNTILRELGVQGIQIQEVIDFDDIPLLPQPVHALIFLYKYKASFREDHNAEYPAEVWFARQTAHNACATYALLNIVNNIPDLHLGSRLKDFRLSTAGMTPLERGQEVDQLHYARAIHNSFATGNELIAADQILQENIEAARKRKVAAKARKAREERAFAKKLKKETEIVALPSRASSRIVQQAGHLSGKIQAANSAESAKQSNGVQDADTQNKPLRRSTRRRQQVENDDAAYHFCAYMPINGRVWKLDGIEPTPEDLGDASEQWLDRAITAVQTWIELYDGQIEFNLMAVVDAPAQGGKANTAAVEAYIRGIERKLNAEVEDWHELLEPGEPELLEDHDNNGALMEADHMQQLERTIGLAELLDLRKKALQDRAMSHGNTRDHLQAAAADEGKAFHRRHDYARFVRHWMEELADAGVLSGLMVAK